MSWPWPADTALDRRTRIAREYRQRLLCADPAGCAELDGVLAAWGENWPMDVLIPDDTAALTPRQVADALGEKHKTVLQWIRRGKITRSVSGLYALDDVQRELDRWRETRHATNGSRRMSTVVWNAVGTPVSAPGSARCLPPER